MNRCLLAALLLVQFPLAAQQVILPYNPDANQDSIIGAPDLLEFLPLFGGYFTPSEVMVDDQTLTQYIEALQLALEEANTDTVPLPMLPGNAPGEMLYWDGTQWTLLPVGESGSVLYLNGATPTWTPFSLELFGIQLTLGCTDSSACNYQGATIEDGTCQYFDACGVCGGPGAIYACGCTGFPQGDCDCQGNVLDAIGNCGGTCSADVDDDGICDDVDDCITEQGCSCGIQPDAIGVCGGSCLSDVDGDGICDDVDLCSDTTACNYSLGNVDEPCISLQLDVHAIHDSGPLAGLTTYRLYVVLPNSTDFLSSISGNSSTPLNITTTTSFYQDDLGEATGNGISTFMLEFFPELIYDSYVTIGHAPEDGTEQTAIFTIYSSDQNWQSAFEAGGDIIMDDDAGGYWFILNDGNDQGVPDSSGKVLIAQLTTDGDISASVVAQVFPDYGCCFGGGADGTGAVLHEVNLSTICLANEPCEYESCGPYSPCAPVEFDGHTYAVVEIGDQCWFAENLRTTVYTNGDTIPGGLTDGEWTSTTAGAAGASTVYGEGSSYCVNTSPDIDACNEAQSLAEYGRLYNWYAVDDARGLCPAGWHVPTDEEWTNLENYITSQGFAGSEGTALKSTEGWSPGLNGTDDFGFTALPGGYRHYSIGSFNNAAYEGKWWSSSPNVGYAWYRGLVHYLNPVILRDNENRQCGLSVRCIKGLE